jgi:hypothetical protein
VVPDELASRKSDSKHGVTLHVRLQAASKYLATRHADYDCKNMTGDTLLWLHLLVLTVLHVLVLTLASVDNATASCADTC